MKMGAQPCGACGVPINHEGFCRLCNERIDARDKGDWDRVDEINEMQEEITDGYGD